MKKIILSMMMVLFGIFSIELSAQQNPEKLGEIILSKGGASYEIDYYAGNVVLADNKIFSQDNVVEVEKNLFLIKLNNHLVIERRIIPVNNSHPERFDTLLYINQKGEKEKLEIPPEIKYQIR